jgi:hypothetical protein
MIAARSTGEINEDETNKQRGVSNRTNQEQTSSRHVKAGICRFRRHTQCSSTGHDVLLFGGFSLEEVENGLVVIWAVDRCGVEPDPLLF